MDLAVLDWLIIAAYFALLLAIGLHYARWAGRSIEEYFLSVHSMAYGWRARALSPPPSPRIHRPR